MLGRLFDTELDGAVRRELDGARKLAFGCG